MIPVTLVILLLVFVLVRASGDPVLILLPEDATASQVTALRESLGLDRPILVQFAMFLANALRGDFGESLRYRGQPALGVVLERLPATLQLAGFAMFVAVLISVPAGAVSALMRNTWLDRVVSTLSVLGAAMPNFWLGIMLMLVFSVQLGVLPVSGREGLVHLVLPGITLGTGLAALLTRLMRSGLLEVIGLDYVRTARSKGLGQVSVLVKHALRNAMLSYVTVVGLQTANLMAGAVVTEQVFAWPGIGLLAVQAIGSRDMQVIQVIVLLSSLIVMSINLLIDLLYAVLDPRIHYA